VRVVSNVGPLIHLSWIDRLNLLHHAAADYVGDLRWVLGHEGLCPGVNINTR
jgi:hypothetical protein